MMIMAKAASTTKLLFLLHCFVWIWLTDALAAPSNIDSLTIRDFFANKKAPKIVTICGSQRKGSFNKMLHDNAVLELKAQGANVEVIDLNALNLPLFNQDDEAESFPDNARVLKEKLVAADGIFITSPEYNGFTTPLLLNAITWATRGEGDMYAGFQGKVATIMATSPGAMGGLRMIRSLTQMLQDMGTTVVPGSNAIGKAMSVFDSTDGSITDDRTKTKVVTACSTMLEFCRYRANREEDCAIAKAILKETCLGEYGEVDIPN